MGGNRVRIIAFEGIDSAGKETQVRLLAEFLSNKGFKVACEHLPRYDKPIGELIGKWLRNEVTLSTEAFHILCEADKADFQDQINDYVQSGVEILLVDRYTLSNLAFGMAKGINVNWLDNIQAPLRKPDLTFILDVSATTAIERKIIDLDRHEEDIQLQNRTRAAYQYLGEQSKSSTGAVVQIIDGNRSPAEIHDDIVLRLSLLSGAWN